MASSAELSAPAGTDSAATHGKDFRAGGRAESAADTAVINMIFHK